MLTVPADLALQNQAEEFGKRREQLLFLGKALREVRKRAGAMSAGAGWSRTSSLLTHPTQVLHVTVIPAAALGSAPPRRGVCSRRAAADQRC